MSKLFRHALLILAAAVLVACGKSQQTSHDAPLAFVPADTPFVYANPEPLPKDVLDAYSHRMQDLWGAVFGFYDKMLDQVGAKDKLPNSEWNLKLAHVLLDELRAHDNMDKLRELGFNPGGRMAIYSVGMMPVLRTELGDPAAFKALIARLEEKTGSKLATDKLGTQEYWHWSGGIDKFSFVLAIEDTHPSPQLVMTAWPDAASDATKQALLGITRPEKNLADAGTLQATAQQYGFTAYGTGYIDTAAIAQRLTTGPTGIDLDLAKAFGLNTDSLAKLDPVCKDEMPALAHKFPRLVAGVKKWAADQAEISLQLELDPDLAKQVMDYSIPAPGTGAPPTPGLLDISYSTPVLKIRDFWIKELDAATAKPLACSALTPINLGVIYLRDKLNTPIPPPFNDLTGVRLVVDHVTLHGKDMPDVSARLLVGLNDPANTFGMLKSLAPWLKDTQVATDGKPVAITIPDLSSAPIGWLAMSDKAIAASIDDSTTKAIREAVAKAKAQDSPDEPPHDAAADQNKPAAAPATDKNAAAALGDYLAAPPAGTPIVARIHMDGKIYGLFVDALDQVKDAMPPEQAQVFEQEKELFSVYAKILRSVDFELEANPHGIAIHETVNLAQ